MTKEMPKEFDIAYVNGLYMFADPELATAPTVRYVREDVSQAQRIDELEERLEISTEHEYDGIECRDETIRLQDKRIEELEGALAEAEDFMGDNAPAWQYTIVANALFSKLARPPAKTKENEL